MRFLMGSWVIHDAVPTGHVLYGSQHGGVRSRNAAKKFDDGHRYRDTDPNEKPEGQYTNRGDES